MTTYYRKVILTEIMPQAGLAPTCETHKGKVAAYVKASPGRARSYACQSCGDQALQSERRPK